VVLSNIKGLVYSHPYLIGGGIGFGMWEQNSRLPLAILVTILVSYFEPPLEEIEEAEESDSEDSEEKKNK
jgi:hypothetical protein